MGLVVLAEEPYAEGMGDRSSLALTGEHRTLVARMRARCDQVAVVQRVEGAAHDPETGPAGGRGRHRRAATFLNE